MSPSHVYLVSDTVTVTHVVYNDCTSDTSYASFYVTGIKDILSDRFLVYPNPVNSTMIVEYPELKKTDEDVLYIYSIKGQLINSYVLDKSGGKTLLDVAKIPAGNYIVCLGDIHDTMYKTKIQIKH